MVQTLTTLPIRWPHRILCYYANTSNQLQIARIRNIPGWRFERLIFPKERLLFEALPEALLEIHAITAAIVTPLQHLSCAQLRVIQHTRDEILWILLKDDRCHSVLNKSDLLQCAIRAMIYAFIQSDRC